MTKFILFFGKFLIGLIKFLRLGSGTVFAGHVAKQLCPNFYISQCVAKNIIYISGTNGKTTTSRLLVSFLGEKNTLHNASGANLEAGLITALIRGSSGKPIENIVFEIDERVLPSILKKKAPDILVCLNLFRDQLDRHGELETLKNLWKKALVDLPQETKLLVNGDDPGLVYLGMKLKKKIDFFGLDETVSSASQFSLATDSTYCPFCEAPLSYKAIYLSHLGNYFCQKCSFQRQKSSIQSAKWPSISPHFFNQYNTLAAVQTALMCGISSEVIQKKIEEFTSAFGRGETIHAHEKEVLMLLSKNSVSLQVCMDIVKDLAAQGKLGGILFAINDLESDGCDISWIWDTEIESYSENIFITGLRANDFALRYLYGSKEGKIAPHVDTNIKKTALRALQKIPKDKILCILPTYTAMLELRKILTGRKILK